MNKLLIGLLIVAAGAGAFLLLRKTNHSSSTGGITKEWIVGKWKTDGTQPGDSNFNKYRYDFHKNGNILRSLNDSSNVDTMHYEWGKNNELLWSERTPSEKEKNVNSTKKVFAVVMLTKDSLQLQSKDSIIYLFTKLQ